MNKTEIVTSATRDIATKSLGFIGKISEWVQSKIGEFGVSYTSTLSFILTLFIGLLFLFIGSKIANRIIKIVLIILGLILLTGTGYIFISNL